MNPGKAGANRQTFERQQFIQALEAAPAAWDVLVIGGGATGLGVAVDAASRGYKTLLLEQSDFAKGTSSRSTKLVHGGVRYLAQGNIRLVYEALRERGLLLQNAPHLVKEQAFVIPCYSRWRMAFYGTGLKIYDWLAGRYRFRKTSFLSGPEVKQLLPTIKTENLQGGILYYDGKFDDARLALNLAQTCAEQGGVVLNYVQVVGLLKNNAGRITGVQAQDLESGRLYQIPAKVVVNATGVFVDEVLQLDEPVHAQLVQPSQGVHVVLAKEFLPGNTALMIPETPDGRVLFAIPWHGQVLVGTTDTPLQETSLEPVALDTEIDFILQTAGQYLAQQPGRQDVQSVFAGLRPLAAPHHEQERTKEISRSHKIMVAPSGLVTITGGKWTTYRQMAADTVEAAIKAGNLPHVPCRTSTLPIHGATTAPGAPAHLAPYGTDAAGVVALVAGTAAFGRQLHPSFPNTVAEVVWAVRHEMARTVEDVLARRLRILFLDAAAAIAIAPQVAAIMAAELGKEEAWVEEQVTAFTKLAAPYALQS